MPEEVVVGEAQVAASRLVEWFRERLLTAETQRDVADEGRVTAEADRRAADKQRDLADQARVSAEDDRRVADEQRADAERPVIEVEQLLVASEELTEQLQDALDTRVVIEQAKGFLAARYGVTPDAAFEAIRRYARHNKAALRDVAADVLTGAPRLEL